MQTAQGRGELDKLTHVEFLGADVLAQTEIGEDIGQCRPGESCRERREEVDTQSFPPMCERTLDDTKEPGLIARGPG